MELPSQAPSVSQARAITGINNGVSEGAPNSTRESSAAQTSRPTNTTGNTPNTQANSETANTNKPPAFLAQVTKILADSNVANLKILSSRQEIQVQAATALKPGQLVMLSSDQSGIKLETDIRQSAQQIMRLLMPKQGSIKNALANLASTTSSPREQSSAQQSEINRLLEKVIQQLPTQRELVNPTKLKMFIKNAGLLTLPTATAPLASDKLKSNPLNTAAIISDATKAANAPRQPLGQLLLPILKLLLQTRSSTKTDLQREQTTKVSEAIARILLSQVRPLNLAAGEEIDARRSEIVARSENQIDGFQLQITSPKVSAEKESWQDESDSTAQSSPDKKWTVRLSFDFPELGNITAFILLSANRHLEMNFWTERPATFALIKEKRKKFQKKLSERMQAQGIETLSIDVFEGEAPRRDAVLTSNLISERV